MTGSHEARGGAPGKLYGCYLAEVVAVKDDQHQGRIQIKLLHFDGVAGQNAAMWAHVAVPFSGGNRGAFLIPSKRDIVVVQFVQGDPAQAIVIGGVWHGGDQAPEQLGGNGDEIDRWTLVGKDGTRIAIVEEQAGATISLTTPNSTESVTITQQNSGKIEIKTSTSTVTLDSQGVAVQTTKFKVTATQIELEAPTVTVNAGLSKFSGIVKADVHQATTVVGTTYTPGAGNIW